jgi:hypothetical protein
MLDIENIYLIQNFENEVFINMQAEFIGTHIKFISHLPKPKTKTWLVVSNCGSGLLGRIAWFARWRKYSFFPEGGTVFEEVCLKEIVDFCQLKTKEHKGLKHKE